MYGKATFQGLRRKILWAERGKQPLSTNFGKNQFYYTLNTYKRLTELLIDVFNLKISEGTIYNTLKIAHTKLEKVENFFKEQLAKSEVSHADEIGTKVNGFRR